MTDGENTITIDVESVLQGKEIIEHLAGLKPYTSLSFVLNEEGFTAVDEVKRLAEWGIPGNRTKLKQAAMDVLTPLLEFPHDTPLNVNLTEFDVKSMGEVLMVIDRSMERHQDGVLVK
jgi:hypothetical protein